MDLEKGRKVHNWVNQNITISVLDSRRFIKRTERSLITIKVIQRNTKNYEAKSKREECSGIIIKITGYRKALKIP